MEDQAIFREMVAELIRSEGREVVGQYATVSDARAALALRPDLVIVDLMLPDDSGLAFIEALSRESPASRSLVVTAQERAGAVLEAFRLGAHGIVTKNTSLAELREGIRRVLEGGTYYCARASEVLRESVGAPPDSELTSRERQVASLVALGRSSKEIAEQLGLATKTVMNHRMRIHRKLGLGDVAGLTRYAVSQGWVPEDV